MSSEKASCCIAEYECCKTKSCCDTGPADCCKPGNKPDCCAPGKLQCKCSGTCACGVGCTGVDNCKCGAGCSCFN
uniref:Metallothionein 2 n=1 Tax=Lottia gigantea TaxID=225164 RepID=A0A6G5YNX4_LOTGI|nr:metallothionein 2 [Lottia gigantea]QLA10384.1 metallothionein 2 [Lottia gigantea]